MGLGTLVAFVGIEWSSVVLLYSISKVMIPALSKEFLYCDTYR
jgi:hypothetical protein